jgi:uncharacterized protein
LIDRLKAQATARWPAPAARRRLLGELGLAIIIALIGAVVFVALNVPLPWMLGALFATTLASMANLRVAVPSSVRSPMIAVLGVLLGSGFNEEVLNGMGLWVPSLLALPLYILIMTVVAIVYLRAVAGLDLRTAYFASTPGGLGEMIILSDRMGGDMRTVSLIHATRVLVVVFAVPFTIRWAEGIAVSGMPERAASGMSATELLVLLLSGVIGAVGAWLVRLPAPMLLGPMVASAAAHLLGFVHGAPPASVVAGAQLVIGASVGCRFKGVDPVRALIAMAASLGLVVIMLVMALAFALALHALTGLPLMLLVLAYVPGGLAEMSIIAYALAADPTFVAAHHIVRIALVVFLAPLLFGIYRRLLGLPEKEPPSP